MLYATLKWAAGIALHWFYRDIEVVAAERVPDDRPVLLAVNHPNQLVDAMLAGWVVRRIVTFTGKAILLDNPAMRLFLGRLPFVPLRRAADERKREPGAAPSAARNADAFRAILDALARKQAVLIFPEGISHNEPQLAPIKTGVARIALEARDDRGLRDICIVPIGLVFENKAEPRTRVLVQVGEPLYLDTWMSNGGGSPVDGLTAEVDARLRAVTLNFPDRDEAERVMSASRLLSGVFDEVRSLHAPDTPMIDTLDVARRVAAARRSLGSGPAERSGQFLSRLDALGAELEQRQIAANDVAVDLGALSGAWFLIRELSIALVAGPLALWGRFNHWAPLAIARALAKRSSTAPEDPAMHTVVAGLATVLVFYAAQTGLVAWVAGAWWALAYLLSLVPSASWDFRYQDRRRRALQRTRTYLLLRRDPALRRRLLCEVEWLKSEAIELEQTALAENAAVRSATYNSRGNGRSI